MQDSGQRKNFGSAIREPDDGKLKTWLAFPRGIDIYSQPIVRILNLTDEQIDLVCSVNTLILMVEENKLRGLTTKDVFCIIKKVVKLYGNTPALLLETFEQFTQGAVKYGDRNWENETESIEYCANYIKSAHRHTMKLLIGMEDELHWGALMFNLIGLYYFLYSRSEE
jgi:hypothetical protein